MSINVLIIPEDFRKDQYVLKPIAERMMEHLGLRAKVRACTAPLLGGVGEALKWKRLEEIIDRYKGMVRLFLLLVDRDGDQNRRARLDELEELASAELRETNRIFLAENAWQEVEVWVLAGMNDLPDEWSWEAIRAEVDPKERYYDSYAKNRGLLASPNEGRDTLAPESAANYRRIRQLCQEDVRSLEERIGERVIG